MGKAYMKILPEYFKSIKYADTPDWIGRRGSVLMAAGIGWLVMGLRVLSEVEDNFSLTEANSILFLGWPLAVRASLWFTTGLIGIFFAFRVVGRDYDGIAYGALLVMPLERFFSYMWAWFVSWPIWPDGIGFPDGWAYAAPWGMVVYFLYICAGWQEPSKKLKETPNLSVGEDQGVGK